MKYSDVFFQSTGTDPYPYQERLAEEEEFPEVLSVPTGMGKTAAAVLSWLYRRRVANESIRSQTPRRLVYCLPMRTLVEQTSKEVQQWVDKFTEIEAIRSSAPIGVHVLMGGSDDGKWYEHPERDVVLIGTQDMLLSRSLNRGYGMSRYRWPMDYALLNNDALWVLDETQLMGVGLTTSAQLQGLREKLQTYGHCHTLWMSATLDPKPLVTVDHPEPVAGWRTETVKKEDLAHLRVSRLLQAEKPVTKAEFQLPSDSAGQKKYASVLAKFIVDIHQQHPIGALTLVILNRVQRAQSVYSEVSKKLGPEVCDSLGLIHSRFRPYERQQHEAAFLHDVKSDQPSRVVIATQAIEAGVDLSATNLITELAPWSSLVQRFGRCNRRGICGEAGSPSAQVVWVDVDTSKTNAECLLPYQVEELETARQVLTQLQDVGPQSLKDVPVKAPEPQVHVLRRKDLLELFDTTPDLSGNDLDVSRYIRETDDSDLQVYWRDWEIGKSNPGQIPPSPRDTMMPAPTREELCSVSIIQFRKYLNDLRKNDRLKHLAWIWNSLDEVWEEIKNPRPGQIILLHTAAGGYNEQLGWTGMNSHCPKPVALLISDQQEPVLTHEGMGQDDTGENPIQLVQHLSDVGREAEKLKEQLASDSEIPWLAVIQAAWWHDVGKAHPAFQNGLRLVNGDLTADSLWAKSGKNSCGFMTYRYDQEETSKKQERIGFRHELASALAFLAHHQEGDTDLVAYLIAAHHGKVRLSIRSMPNENRPPDSSSLFARGLWDGDLLPEVEIGNGETCPSMTFDLSLMKLGDHTILQDGQPERVVPSWLSRTLKLRDEYGPFRLAYLETLVRIADWRGSKIGEQA